jgi:hypothetical protein
MREQGTGEKQERNQRERSGNLLHSLFELIDIMPILPMQRHVVASDVNCG